jgi:hypothetical protein
MWSVLGSLISNFLLLRDLFGYAIPGAVFLGIAGYFEVTDYSKLPLASEPPWLKAIVAVTASYAVGHVLAAIGYAPNDIRKIVCKLVKRLCKTAAKDETDAEKLYYRYRYPSMFIEADRRETATILRMGLWVAFIFAAFLPALPTFLHIPFLGIGSFMFLNAHWSLFTANCYSDSAVSAAKTARDNKIPIFDWNGGGGSGSAET